MLADGTWAFADDAATVSLAETTGPAERESDSFRRWVNRRWPNRDQRESENETAKL